jgi:glycosyltransferase involved in cell wall biosynthesis
VSAECELSICAPAYNEEANLERVVAEWLAMFAREGVRGQIVITDDGSRDSTGAILDRLASEHPNVKAVHFAENGGYGRALRAAIQAADGRLVMTIDSDGQFDAGDYAALRRELEAKGLDLVTGYRLGKRDSALRVLADRALNRLVRWMFHLDLRDTNCALKLARREAIRSLTLEARGYPAPTEICIKAQAHGLRIGEVGVTHREREAGASKLHPWRTGWQFLAFLLYLRRRRKHWRRGVIGDF